MSRTSGDEYDRTGRLVNGYDYINQAWVAGGVYQRCGHPEAMNCACFARLHAGEAVHPGDRTGATLVQNGHVADCDAAEEPYYNQLCSMLCPLQYRLGGIAAEEVAT